MRSTGLALLALQLGGVARGACDVHKFFSAGNSVRGNKYGLPQQGTKEFPLAGANGSPAKKFTTKLRCFSILK